jgi:MerR family transcriptional regulator, redox-sensitive transcriptional activator SoxR
MTLSAELTIGQLAARTGLAVSAIRYYETEGLVKSNRTSGGQRRFGRAELRRLSVAMVAQQLGYTIAEIRGVLSSLPADRIATKDDWTRISHGFRTDLDRRIAMMTKLRDTLDGCIGCGCLSLKNCQLYNKDDGLASRGAGPRLVLDATSRS